MNTDQEKNKPSAEEILEQAAKTIHSLGEAPSIVKDDDEFQFECQQCGACCIGRDDIILNPFDIYNAASRLGITCAEFVVKYTHRDLGGSSKMPLVTIKMDKETGSCPFLKFDYMHDGKFKCSIHDAKPGACRSHPIGIMSECEIDDNGDISLENLNFIKVDQCDQSKAGPMHKVKDWMSYYNDHKEESLMAHHLSIMTNSIVNWRRLFVIVGILTVSAESKGFKTSNDVIARAYNALANIFVECCYVRYDTSKPFLEQCNENYEFLKNRFNIFAERILPSIELLFEDACGSSIDEIMDSAKENKEYNDKDGNLILEKLIYDIGTNHCTYTGEESNCEGDEPYGDDD